MLSVLASIVAILAGLCTFGSLAIASRGLTLRAQYLGGVWGAFGFVMFLLQVMVSYVVGMSVYEWLR